VLSFHAALLGLWLPVIRLSSFFYHIKRWRLVITFGGSLWLHLEIAKLFAFIRLLHCRKILFLVPAIFVFVGTLLSVVIASKLDLVGRVFSEFAVSVDEALKDLKQVQLLVDRQGFISQSLDFFVPQ